MPSKQKGKPTGQKHSKQKVEEPSEESYDMEDEDEDVEIEDISEDIDEDDNDDDGEMREVNKANLLNYESDDDSDEMEGEDSDEFGTQIKKQKEDLLANDAWGRSKKSFYGRDKKRDDVTSSDDDEDEYKEAVRLQKVRAKKLQMHKDEEEEDQQEEEQQQESEEEEEESEDEEYLNNKSSKKLGDRLFADNDGEGDEDSKLNSITLNTKTLDDLTNNVNPKLLKQIIDKESPEMQGLLQEFQESLDTLNNKLRPILEKAAKKQIETKHGMTYLEMKYNLLLSYCTFLSFYLLMKVEGKPVKDHPVIFKLAHIKTLIEKLKPLDQRLQYQVDKLLRTAAVANVTDAHKAQDNMKYKPNPKNLQASDGEEEEEEDENDEEEEENESDNEDDQEGEIDDDESMNSDDKAKKQIYKATKLNPVLYEDKETKKQRREELIHKKKMGKSQYIDDLRREMYDEPEEIHLGLNKKTKISKEHDMIEEMEQEHFKRMSFSKKELKKQKQRAQDELQENLDNLDDMRDIENIVSSQRNKDRQQMQVDAELENSKFSKGLNNYIKNAGKQKKGKGGEDMLEESQYKKKKSNRDNEGEAPSKKKKLNFNDFQAKGNVEGDELYQGHQEKLRDKKAKKKEQGKEAKQARQDEVQNMDQSIQRNVSYEIMKNKGLTRKRKKIDRNSRVKLREKFRKANIKRNSKISEFKEGPKGKYSGEKTGIKSGIIKSTMLT